MTAHLEHLDGAGFHVTWRVEQFQVSSRFTTSMSTPTNGTESTDSTLKKGVKHLDRIGHLCKNPNHVGEVVSFYCEDCSKAGCTLCSMKDHYNHKKVFMSDQETDEGSFGHTGIFFPPEFTIDGLLKNLNEDLQQIDVRSEDAKEKIKTCVSTYKDSLETKKKLLIDHINAVKRAKLNFLQEQQKQLRKTLEELVGSVSYAKRYLESDDHFGLLSAEKEITKRLVELNEKCSKVVLPTEREWNLDKIKVIRDGKYVKFNRSRRLPSPQVPGIKTIHDPEFKPVSVALIFNMEQYTLQAFIRTCCQELGEKYWLRVT